MRKSTAALVASLGFAVASPTVFSVHDDILAFPQYEVVFSESYLSDHDADSLIARLSSASTSSGDLTDVQSSGSREHGDHGDDTGAIQETYETMYLYDQEYLCTIPKVKSSPRNESSEREARAQELKELARATDRGWALLQEMEGNCLYSTVGWWTYKFCYGRDVTQFHQLTPGGHATFPPKRDPVTAQYTLGRTVGTSPEKGEDEYGNEIEVHKGTKRHAPPKTEMQIKGDTRYLSQHLDSGTTCDLTGKPRRIEVQYHCSMNPVDRIGRIEETTTCAYVMVVYTPRLCGDDAFLPPKEGKASTIACRMVVPGDEVSYWEEMKTLEAEIMMGGLKEEGKEVIVNIGGVIIGGQKQVGFEGAKLPIPKGFTAVGSTSNLLQAASAIEVLAISKGEDSNGKVKVEALSEEQLQKLDLDPKWVEGLKKELEEMAKGRSWKLEMVDGNGEMREIRGIVDPEDEELEIGDRWRVAGDVKKNVAKKNDDVVKEETSEKTGEKTGEKGDEKGGKKKDEEGTEETYHEEL